MDSQKKIDELKEKIRNLEKKTDFQNKIINGSDALIAVFDVNLNIVFSTEKFNEIFFGNGKPGLRKIFEVENNLANFVLHVNNCFNSSKSEYFTTIFQNTEYKVTLKPYLNSLDFVQYLIGTFSKIENLAQKSLIEKQKIIKQKEQRFKNLFNLGAAGVFVANKKGEIIEINQKFLKLFGYTIHELKGSGLVKLISSEEDYLIQYNTAFEQLKENKEFHSEFKAVKKNKEFFYIEVYASKVVIDGVTFIQGIVHDISNRKKIEKALYDTEKKYQTLFEEAGDAIFIMKDELIINCNNATLDLFGYDNKNEIIGKYPYELSPKTQFNNENSKERALDIISKVKAGSSQKFNWLHRKNNGEVFEAEVSLNAVYIENEMYIQAILRDITKKRDLQKELENENERLGSILSQIQVGVIIFDANYNIEWTNEHTQKLFPFGEPIGKKCYQFFELKDNPCDVCAVNEAFKTGEVVVSESYNKALDRWFLSSAHPLSFENGKPTRMLEAVMEITSLKKAEQKAKNAQLIAEQNEKQFSLLFENMTQGFALHKIIYNTKDQPVDYEFIKTNKAFEKITGLNNENIIGKTVLEIMPNIEKIWIDNYARVAKTGVPMRFENYSSELEKYYDVVVYSPLKGYFAVIFTDISQNKKNETRLIKAKEKAEKSNELKTAFLHNISHEFRTPLNGIIGFADLLISSIKANKEQKLYAENINLSCQRLLDIVTDTIEISKIQSKNIETYKSEFNLIELIDTSILKYKQKAINKGILLQKEINLPEILFIESDKEKLTKAIGHVIDNAVKFTNSGKVTIKCSISNNNIELFVVDTGIGIPEDFQKFVFEPYRQTETKITRNYGGNGIGLSLVKAYIELLDGKIKISSKENQGTTVRISLPYTKKTINNDIKQEINTNKENKLQDKVILVVEDEDVNFMYLNEILTQTKAKVYHAINGLDAVEFCKEYSNIDLVLMDIRTPVMDGFEATKEIKKIKNIPVIAQTAYVKDEEAELLADAGFDGFISKPIKQDLLLSIVKRHLQ